MNYVFANHSDDDKIYLLIIKEIAQKQQKDQSLRSLPKEDEYKLQLVENTEVRCKDGKLDIQKWRQHRTVS